MNEFLVIVLTTKIFEDNLIVNLAKKIEQKKTTTQIYFSSFFT